MVLVRTGRDDDKILGDDPTITGWPWVEGPIPGSSRPRWRSWPSIAKRRGDHPRVREGIRMILDRALDRGGWNCGNKSVFGRELRPMPGPTGTAVLALAAGKAIAHPRCPAVLDYLLATLPKVRAPVSLGWGVYWLFAPITPVPFRPILAVRSLPSV